MDKPKSPPRKQRRGSDAGQTDDRTHMFDTIVVGGGIAGLATARELGCAGDRVILLEARDRLGGRVYYDRFADTDEFIEFGGNWFAPAYQPLIAAEIERYGLGIAHSDAGTAQRTLSGGRLLTGALPVPHEDIIELERAVWEVLAASRRITYGKPWETQDVEDLDVSWREFVERLALSQAVEEYLLTWTSASIPEETSALNIIVVFPPFNHSAWAVYTSMEDKFADGTRALVDSIARDTKAEIRLDNPVARIEQSEAGVTVTCRDGSRFRGRTCVLATPVNTWDDVIFEPGLSEPKAAVAAAKHVGKGGKAWMLLADMPTEGLVGWGLGDGINWLLRDRRTADGDLYLGFTGGRDLDVGDHDAVARAVHVFAPEARVVKTDAHDWTRDEYAKGVWAVYRPGHFTRYHSALSRPEGRLYFAGADVSFGQQPWIEGALESAFQVAGQIIRDDQPQRTFP